MKKIIIALGLGVVLAAGTAWAGFDGPNIRVDHEPTSLNAVKGKVAADNAGHVYVAWEDERSGAGVYLNYSHDNGGTWQSSDTFLEIPGSSYLKDLKILTDQSGHVYVTWIYILNSAKYVAFGSSSDYGATWSTQTVNVGEPGWWVDDVDMDHDESGHVCLAASEGGSFPLNLYSNCSADYGATWMGTHVKINTNNPVGGQTQRSIQICMDDGGHVYSAWADGRDGVSGGWKYVYFNSSDDYGETWGQEQRIEPPSFAKHAGGPQIACDNGGNVHVIWHSFDGQSYQDYVYYNHSADYGVTWPSRQWFTTTGAYPQVQAASGGRVYVSWIDISNAPYHTIRFRRSTDGGNSFDSEVQINTSHDTEQDHYALKAAGNKVGALWENVEPWETIYAKYSEDGGVTWQAEDIDVSNGGYNSDFPDLAMSGGGEMYAVWQDNHTAGYNIYFKTGSPDGQADVSVFQDFEPGNGSDEYGWAYTGATAELSTEQVHGGTRAWKVSSGQMFAGTGLQSQTQRWDMDFRPDINDRLTFWVWSDPATPADNTVLLKLSDTGTFSTGFDVWTTESAAYQEWTQIEVLFSQLPDGFDLNHVNKIEIFNYDAGTYYFDDFEVTAKDRVYQAFEDCADAGDCGWAWGGTIGLQGTIGIEEEYVYEGETAWRLNATENWAGTGVRAQVKSYDAVNDEQSYWHVDLNPEFNDRLTFWVYNLAENGLANNLAVQFFDHDQHFEDPVVYWTTERAFYGEWTKLTVPFDELPPSLDLTNINKIQFQVYWKGVYYFDDIRATRGAPALDKEVLPDGNIAWGAVSGAYAYEVQRSDDGDEGWETIFTGSATGFGYNGLSPKYLRVRWSEETSFLNPNRYVSDWQSPVLYQPPQPVIDYDALAEGDIAFIMTGQGTQYQVESAEDPNGPWSLLYDGPSTVLTGQAEDYAYYRVRAVREVGGQIVDQTDWSPAVSYRPGLFVKASGQQLREDNGQGSTLVLRGINLGNLLLIEPEFTGIGGNFTGSIATDDDDYGIRENLIARFGDDDLLLDYQAAYITEMDFDHIMRTGANFVRLPIYYRVVEDASGNFTRFDKIDEVIRHCANRGLYVLLDLHGAPGAQSEEHHAGRMDYNKLFEDSSLGEDYRARTVAFWDAVSERYKDNPVVVGYDILNEPFGADDHDPTFVADNGLWTLYDAIYDTIRANDSQHLIVMETIPSEFDWNTLPDPDDYSWQNVMYQVHYYCFLFDEEGNINGICSTEGHEEYLFGKITNAKQSQYNVPVLVGEFNGFDHRANWLTHMQNYTNEGWSWAMWSYKTHPSLANWGLFVHEIDDADLPDVTVDSAQTLQQKFARYTTARHIADTSLTMLLSQYLKPQAPSITVNITPASAVAAGAQWRLRRGPDTGWHDSGETIDNLRPGTYKVVFKRLHGFDKPANQYVTVIDAPVTVTGDYVERTDGSVTVTIQPSAAAAAGAQWRLSSGPDTSWKDSGDTIVVPKGRYRIRFKKISGYYRPNTIRINVGYGQAVSRTGFYMPKSY
ncbi:MAG: cellulase family glycosylhydrolase [Candidatus Omnitrophica bacterium]|nr:cellulase family glycosylhydrolase [Candidatus Omnitrophota bacterium]